MKTLYFVIPFLFLSFLTLGQDIHFSQFYMNPIYLNPALAGNYDGDWRFTANQKSQWRSVSRPYNTFAISAENKEQHLLPGLYYALNLYNDVAGDGNLRTIEVNISSAYQKYVDKDSIHSVTLGVQFGLNHKNIDFTKLNFDSQFDGYKFDVNLPQNENFNIYKFTNANLAIGGLYTYKPNKRKEIIAGFGWFNLTTPKQSFFGNPSVERDKRVVLHAKANYPLNFEFDLQPGIFMQFQGEYKEILIGSNVKYIYIDKKGEYIAPYAGLWFRNRDAINIVVGAYYNNWIAGVSYDVNVSKLVLASNVRGGLEFSLQYILHIFKPLDTKYRICPDYL
ncbi:MAG TPA: type IX secretion system membrane protein PorP/SprF [Crocinitomix sp.]|nr:type IX secretion system membrane protein PorP/SprF [Crocinitomix sp.]